MAEGKTVAQLFGEGVTKMRREPWNRFAYLEVQPVKGTDGYGPWVTVHDVRTEPFKVLITQVGATEPIWEPWHPPEEENGDK